MKNGGHLLLSLGSVTGPWKILFSRAGLWRVQEMIDKLFKCGFYLAIKGSPQFYPVSFYSSGCSQGMPYALQHERTLLCVGAQVEGAAFGQTTWIHVPLLTSLWIALLGWKLPVKQKLLLKAKRRCWISLGQAGLSATRIKQMLKNTTTVLGVDMLSPKEQKHEATNHNCPPPALSLGACLSKAAHGGSRWEGNEPHCKATMRRRALV